jgi:hypothetical protein
MFSVRFDRWLILPRLFVPELLICARKMPAGTLALLNYLRDEYQLYSFRFYLRELFA